MEHRNVPEQLRATEPLGLCFIASFLKERCVVSVSLFQGLRNGKALEEEATAILDEAIVTDAAPSVLCFWENKTRHTHTHDDDESRLKGWLLYSSSHQMRDVKSSEQENEPLHPP